MSNIFLKNDFDGIFNSTTESAVPLPKWISIVDIASNQTNSVTSSASVQKGGKYSATSSNLNNSLTSSASVQLGGKYSATSNVSSAKDVNKLISMLTSDSSSQKLNNASETTTVSLENQLREILEKEGGGKKKKSKSQKGGSENISIENIKKFFTTLKSQGVDVNVKLNNKTMTDFFGGAENTTTEIPNQNYLGSETSSVIPQNYLGSETSSVIPQNYLGSETSSYAPQNNTVSETSYENSNLVGGAKKGKKSSKKSSKKMDGGMNPGFQAFLDLKKHVAQKLGISNGPKAAKVAGAVQKEMSEKHSELNYVKISEEARKHFYQNVDHFKQMLN